MCGRLPNWAQLGGNKDMIAPEAKVKVEGKSNPRYKGPQSIYLVTTHKTSSQSSVDAIDS